MRILVAIDDSEHSFVAARALSHLAVPERLVLLHALDVPAPAYPMMMPEVAQDLYHMVERDMREEGERLLNRAASILPDGIGPAERTLEIGTPAEVIVSYAVRERIHLIVMGVRGLSPAKEILVGSVSHRVVAHASSAVLTVPSSMPVLRKILLAVEGEADACRAIEFFMKKPFKAPTEVEVLTVLSLPHGRWTKESGSEALQDMALRSAQHFAENIAARLSTVQCCAVSVTQIGSPAATILQRAEALQPDLIMVGAHTGKAATRFLLGSVSHKILHMSHRPVLTIR
jgi:nucleotide-binding universal stress UspA family protein